ncbi:MAG: nucleoid-associated protein, YbaB/EbfC family [Gammaproteobacteria bacterium RIFCSPHIGHO2_12_FULL_35_23]|nr:MAG: nucleoid-associated protein, YbaB/EbfC family [Gammaproteobacteria bacterium RIFCSPHIGHO2_12_FULL_35_23]
MPSNDQLNNLMTKAKEMQDQMKSIQSKIANIKVTGEAGGGLVKVIMKGNHSVESVEISPTLMGEEPDMLEDLVAAAINSAAAKVEKQTKEEMLQLAKDMNLPENFGM